MPRERQSSLEEEERKSIAWKALHKVSGLQTMVPAVSAGTHGPDFESSRLHGHVNQGRGGEGCKTQKLHGHGFQ